MRTILWRTFGLASYSKYDDRGDIGSDAEVSRAVGHRFLEAPWPDFYSHNRETSELVLVKTHDPPRDNGRTIYIVRDGRAAIVSWFNMLHRLRGRHDIGIEDIIRGRKVAFGSWSNHLERWRPLTRPDTLFVRYEDLLTSPERAIEDVAAFLDRSPQQQWRNEFDRLHQIMPGFFAAADNAANIEQMSPEQTALFWRTHERWMTALGYGRAD